MNNKKKIIIVGAGPGGLTAGMILASRGFDVHIFEKNPNVGGRNSSINIDGFTFDVGPTFLMMKFILDEVFELAKRRSENYLELIKLDPMYRLFFKDKSFDMTDNQEKMREIIAKEFKGNEEGYDRLKKKERRRYKKKKT